MTVFLALVACRDGSLSPPKDETAAAVETLRTHLTFLTDDRLAGRGTGSKGFELAAQYVAARFTKLGLEGGGPDGSYFQAVRFRRAKAVPSASSFVITDAEKTSTFSWGTDFVARGDLTLETVTVRAPIVFVGYGISDPTSGHDDYMVDVRGAIVAFLPGVPESLPADRREYYTSVKWSTARQRGAIATIELSTPAEDRTWSWTDRMEWVRDWAATSLDASGRPPADAPLPRILLSSDGTARLLSLASRTLSEVSAAPGSFRIETAAVTFGARHEEVTAPHVIGILRGSDPELRHEYVLYTAHLDGLGQEEPVAGDDIYNSAIDNALGAAMVLTLAQRFSGLSPRPQRSILFIATTGEELGIAGSPYFVEYPTVPLASIVAAINIDGPTLMTDPVTAVLAMGASNSTLGTTTAAAAATLGLQTKPAAAPLNFSDHYPFVMKGIPALWLVQDGQSSETAKEAQARIHTPRDDMSRSFRWESGAVMTELNFQIGRTVATQAERPRWNTGDILGEAFAR